MGSYRWKESLLELIAPHLSQCPLHTSTTAENQEVEQWGEMQKQNKISSQNSNTKATILKVLSFSHKWVSQATSA